MKRWSMSWPSSRRGGGLGDVSVVGYPQIITTPPFFSPFNGDVWCIFQKKSSQIELGSQIRERFLKYVDSLKDVYKSRFLKHRDPQNTLDVFPFPKETEELSVPLILGWKKTITWLQSLPLETIERFLILLNRLQDIRLDEGQFVLPDGKPIAHIRDSPQQLEESWFKLRKQHSHVLFQDVSCLWCAKSN